MRAVEFMVIAGEASGDILAAELVKALQDEVVTSESAPTDDVQPLQTCLAPNFFGAGGPCMAEAGVELAFDLTQHSVIGLWEVFKNYHQFARLFNQLLQLAIQREPDAIICVDFSGFNRRFARAIKNYVRRRGGPFLNWNPRIVQYVSPQVWASREGRAKQLAQDVDLLLSIFPFEPGWYASREPQLRVEFVGHPMIDRYQTMRAVAPSQEFSVLSKDSLRDAHGFRPAVVLLPGSRGGELSRHLPLMVEAARQIHAKHPVRLRMVLPHDRLADQARGFLSSETPIQIQTCGLAEALAEADLVIASTGTVTMECAYFGVPTVAIYKTSWATYQVAKRVVKVKYVAMPNILANEPIYPEFIQNDATPEKIVRAALDLLNNQARRTQIKEKLAKVVASLGGPGANQRAAQAIIKVLRGNHSTRGSASSDDASS
jgi:lipid-A-disaccharide synthase